MRGSGGYLARVIAAASLCVVARQVHGQPTWRVDSAPFLDIAATARDGQVIIGDMAGAVRHSDGTIVVADKSSSNLRHFDAAGRLVRTSGREGDGPGEFRVLTWIGRCGSDTSFVWDIRLRRMSAVDVLGHVGRQFRLPQNPSNPIPYAFACSTPGWLVMLGAPPLTQLQLRDDPSIRLPAPVVVTSADGRVLRTLASVNTQEFTMSARAAAPLPRPLGLQTYLAAGKDRIYVGTGDSSIVHVYNVAGAQLSPIRLPGSRRRATRKHFETAVEEMIAYEPDSGARSMLRRVFGGLPMPANLPPHGALIVDSNDLLWVVRSVIGDPETNVDVFDGTGKQVARVRIPRFINIYHVGNDVILGGYMNAAGEQHLLGYRLRRTRG